VELEYLIRHTLEKMAYSLYDVVEEKCRLGLEGGRDKECPRVTQGFRQGRSVGGGETAANELGEMELTNRAFCRHVTTSSGNPFGAEVVVGCSAMTTTMWGKMCWVHG
jgi:hypothetical protein